MSNTFAPRTGEYITPVALAPVNDSYYADNTLEPAMVRIRAQNEALLYLSSTNRGSRSTQIANYSDSVISAPGGGILANKIKRIGLAYLQFWHYTPCINDTNNLLYMFVSSTQRVYTVVLTPGNYNTPQLLYTEFVRAAGAVAGAYVTFDPVFKGRVSPPAGVTAPLYDGTVTLWADSPVYFLPQSPFMQRGNTTFNLPTVNGSRWDGYTNPIVGGQLTEYLGLCFTQCTSGNMMCRYSAWVDFNSKTITGWTKNATTSSRAATSTLLYRLYLGGFEGYSTQPGEIIIKNDYVTPPVAGTAILNTLEQHRFDSNVSSPTFMTMNPDIPISTVDIELLDDHGGYFYTVEANYKNASGANPPPVASGLLDFDGGIRFEMAFSTQI